MPNTDTLAANHGQKRSEGFAARSDSSMISMPFISIWVRRCPASRVCMVSLMGPTVAPGDPRVDGNAGEPSACGSSGRAAEPDAPCLGAALQVLDAEPVSYTHLTLPTIYSV